MKKIVFTLCSTLYMVAFGTVAMAVETKTEAEMKKECQEKWKDDAKKVENCVKGKKGYQKRMENAATKDGKAEAKPEAKPAAKKEAKPEAKKDTNTEAKKDAKPEAKDKKDTKKDDKPAAEDKTKKQ